MIRFILYGILIWVSFLTIAQQLADKKTIKLIEKADVILKDREFGKARELLKSAISRSPDYSIAYHKLFIVLRIMALEDELHALQLEYMHNVPEKYQDDGVWQNLASREYNNGNYQLAKEYLSKVSTNRAGLLFESIDFALDQIENEQSLIIEELPATVNSLKFQYLPVLTIDQRTMFYTARRDEFSDEDILMSIHDGQDWQQAGSVSDKINSPYNEGACAVSADGRTLIFTSCEGRQSYGNCDLYISEKTGNDWSIMRNLGRVVNSRFWDSQPALTADGKTLFFVSNRPGGVGGRDIWVTTKLNGEWVDPVNVGPPINTRNDETTPFIHADSRTLFFSSNGHIGMGGYDLYKAEMSNGNWTFPENLGYPLNTYHDEVSLFITADGNQAYFAKEITNEGQVLSSKIMSYELNGFIIHGVNYVTGIIKDKKANQPLSARIELIDLNSNEKSYSTESDPITGRYFFTLPLGSEFAAFVEHPGYLYEELSFSLTQTVETDTINFYLSPIESGARLIMKNIYFDFDSDKLDKKSFVELDRVVGLMKENNEIRIELSGHTDDKGTRDYNMDLSTRRATSVKAYLINQGIDAARIESKGYGDIQPLAPNNSDANRAMNRRIEFKVVQ